jgi:hypothetical protein
MCISYIIGKGLVYPGQQAVALTKSAHDAELRSRTSRPFAPRYPVSGAPAEIETTPYINHEV